MAPRRVHVEDDGEAVIELTPEEQALADLKAKLGKLGGAFFARVYIERDNGAKDRKKGQLPMEEIFRDPACIADRFGGGTYYYDVVDDKGEWVRRGLGPFSFDPGSYGPEKELDGAGRPVTRPRDAAAPAAARQPEADPLFKYMLAAEQRQHEITLKLIEQGRQQAAPLTLTDVRELMRDAGAAAPAGLQLKDVMDVVNGIVERVKGKGEHDGDPLNTAVYEGIKMLSGLLHRVPAIAAGAPPAAPAAPVVPAHTLNGGNGAMDPFKAIYALYVPKLVRAQLSGVTADVAASSLWDQLPEEAQPGLYELLQRPDVLDYLARFDANVKAAPEWWGALKESLLANYAEETEPEETSVP